MSPTRPCPRCSTPNEPTNQFCARCGSSLATKFFTTGVVVLFVVLGLVAVGSVALFLVVKLNPKSFEPTPPTTTAKALTEASPAPTPTPAPLTPAEILSKAKGMTGEDASKQELGEAADMLRTIPKEAKEYKEAKPLLDKTAKRWARLEAEELVLGPKPENSGWNGKVHCVDSYLKSTLNDYDSSEYLEWSPVTRVELKGEPFWAVKLKLRAKNAFGAYIVKDVGFFIRQNEVVKSVGL